MNEQGEVSNEIHRLIEELGDKAPVVREKSREKLIQLGGHNVTRALVIALLDPRTQVRWEAAKSLQAIADPVTAPALMNAMDDEDPDVRWVAAEGLSALGEVGLRTLLSGLIKRAGTIVFCHAAHHALHEMKAYAKVVAPVIEALGQSEPAVFAPSAAYDVLVTLGPTPEVG